MIGEEIFMVNQQFHESSVLILDDDPQWLEKLKAPLEDAGFKCRETQLASEAIDIALNDHLIKIALIDEILFVPPIPTDENQRILQDFQGSGVIREIKAKRPDIAFFMVTSEPRVTSKGDINKFTQETIRLQKDTGVIELIHKEAIDKNPEKELIWLTKNILDSTSSLISKNELSKSDKLSLVKQFLEKGGAEIDNVKPHSQSLRILNIQGRFRNFVPIPVIVVDNPTREDVNKLAQLIETSNKEQQKHCGILIYNHPPDSLVRLALGKLRHECCVIIPIQFARVEQALLNGEDTISLLAEYANLYLSEIEDLFADVNPIRDACFFFNRGELLNNLQEHLLKNQSVALFGMRKSGITSLLFQFSFLLQQHPIVYIDLKRYINCADIFKYILQKLATIINSNTNKCTPNLEKLDPDSFVQQVLDFAQLLQENLAYELPIICILDEVEQIIPKSSESIEKVQDFRFFMEALEILNKQYKKLIIIITNVYPFCDRIKKLDQQDRKVEDEAFDFLEELFVPPFSEENTTKMLNDIGASMNVSFDNETLQKIYQTSNGNPCVARQIASFIYQKVDYKTENKIFISQSKEYLQNLLYHSDKLRDYIEYSVWEELKKLRFESMSFDFELLEQILRFLACNEEKHTRITMNNIISSKQIKFTETQKEEALLYLEKIGLTKRERTGDNCYFLIQLPLLSQWLRMGMTDDKIAQWSF